MTTSSVGTLPPRHRTGYGSLLQKNVLDRERWTSRQELRLAIVRQSKAASKPPENYRPRESTNPGAVPPSQGWSRVLRVPSLVLLGLVYMVPLAISSTYGIVVERTGGRLSAAYAATLAAPDRTAACPAPQFSRTNAVGHSFGVHWHQTVT